MVVHSGIEGIEWPPIPRRRASALMAMLFQLDKSQWDSPETLRSAQFKQLLPLIRHTAITVPCYRERLDNVQRIDDSEALMEHWNRIPILTRGEVQGAGESIISDQIPESHGPVHSLVTSGSTGQPLVCRGTQVTRFFWHCITLRDHHWHSRDFSRTLAAIRYADQSAGPPEGSVRSSWGAPVDLISDSGSSAVLTTDSTTMDQADWLRRICPAYVIAYPSCIKALAKIFMEHDWPLPGIIHFRSFGEILEDETRRLCEQAWGVPIVDCYSSQEVGYIALECPNNAEMYHLQSETALTEVINEDGRQCIAGETGRVVVTPLHNAAMPLIRYDLGDFAEIAEPCPCGRGLPALRRIVGRQRNMVTLPNGRQRWPGLGRGDVLAEIPPLKQFQIVQTALDTIEIRLVQPAPFTDEQERRLADHVCRSLGYPFDAKVRYVEEIPRSQNGKFEEFVSLL